MTDKSAEAKKTIPTEVTRPDAGIADCASPEILDLTAIEERNTQRTEIKNKAAAAPWILKTNVYRGYGSKYEVRRKNPPKFDGDHPPDEIIVSEGLDKQNKEFIAFARNDNAEEDINILIAKIRQLEVFEQARQKMALYITQLEAHNQELKNRVSILECELKASQDEHHQFILQTEHLYTNAAVLRQALEYYANDDNWNWQFVHNPILRDNGDTARKALEQSQSGAELLDKVKRLESVAEAAGAILNLESDVALPVENLNALMNACAALQDS